MSSKKLVLVIFLNIFYVSDCARRIKDGEPVVTDKRYVVYLVKAPKSEKVYDAWVCGGAIVSNLYIITSAACVNDVEFIYAIAGYKKYVRDEEIDNDQCTSTMKKKIVFICIPMKYELDYHKLFKWSQIDIALVKVESPYDFEDTSYKTLCSYIPTSIRVNYEMSFQEPGQDGLVLGWGHTEEWRKPEDVRNLNSDYLRYARIKILDKEICKKHYEKFPGMNTVIDNYMICTLEKGALNETGQMDPTMLSMPKLEGCDNVFRMLSNNNEPCEKDLSRREILRSNQTSNDTVIETKNRTFIQHTNESRKSGICQNDHGGPLVAWVGSAEYIIGVASVFKVSQDSKCMGPYLYTSTQCNGAFINCILDESNKQVGKKRRAICDSSPIQRGYDTVERYISWKEHPAGAAENEVKPANEKYLAESLFNHGNTKPGVSIEFERMDAAHGRLTANDQFLIRPQRPLKH